MKRKYSACLSLTLASAFFLSACGTQDYASPPADSKVPGEEKRNPAPQSPLVNQHPPASEWASPGYMWGGLEWIGVSNETVSGLKCRLEDGPSVSEFKVFGAAILGGAILGIVIRSSGSWFLGKPTDPGPGHWFWNRLDETIKTVSQGGFRGALLAGGCETLLAGGNFTPLAGFLGQTFAALSGAITLGVMSSIAAAPYLKRLMSADSAELAKARRWRKRDSHGRFKSKDPDDPDDPPDENRGWGGAAMKLNKWSKTSDLGRGIRYRVAPGLTILGLGSGAGLIIYDWLQPDDDRKEKCGQAKQPSQ